MPDSPMARLERFPMLRRQQPFAYAITIAVCLASGWLRLAVDGWFPPGYPFLTFFPAVIVSAFLFGVGPGVVAATLCGAEALFGFIAPPGEPLGSGSLVAMGFYTGVVAVDLVLVHWMQRANARLLAERERSRELAAHTEVLFHELQHRVGNNLQMVGAMLNLQRHSASEPAVKTALADAATKLQLIGRIQRQLYGTGSTKLDCEAHLSDVVRDLVDAHGKPGIACEFAFEPGITLGPEAAVPVALIVAEAVANAIEHGFAGREAGRLKLDARRRNGALHIILADDGAGLPESFEPAQARSLGLRIMQTLAKTLDAKLAWADGAPGVVMTLVLPDRSNR